MKIREQFIVLVGIPLFTVMVLTLVGWRQISFVGSESKKVEQLLDMRTLCADGDRDAYQAYLAVTESNRAVNTETVLQSTKSFDENSLQVIERVGKALSYDNKKLQELKTSFTKQYKEWNSDSKEILALQKEITEKNIERTRLAEEALKAFSPMRDMLDIMGEKATNEAQALILNADRDAYQAYVAQIQVMDIQDRASFNKLHNTNKENIGQVGDRTKRATTAENSADYNKFKGYYDNWKMKNEALFALSDAIIDKIEKKNSIVEENKKLFGEMRNSIDVTSEELAVIAQNVSLKLEGAKKMTVLIFILLGVISFIIALIYAMRKVAVVTKAISCMTDHLRNFSKGQIAIIPNQETYVRETLTKRGDEFGEMGRAFLTFTEAINEQITTIETIADGELEVEVHLRSDDDALGTAVEQMKAELTTLISQVKEMATSVTIQSSQLSDASLSLSSGATEQAASLEEINSSMTLISSKMNDDTTFTDEVSTIVEAASDKAQLSISTMQEMQETMQHINSNAEETRRVIKVIDDIAFQTNLLALNAAVEAARAGQYGKGFAVVAEEVRNLATRSAKAATETTALIETSNSETGKGVELLTKTAESLEELVKTFSGISDSVKQVNSSSKEQAHSISEIQQALTQVDAVTQQNSAHSEETSSAAEEMNKYSKDLLSAINRFHTSRDEEEEYYAPEEETGLPIEEEEYQ